MSAYLIFMRAKTLDEHEPATYSKELLATLAGHEVKVLTLHGSHEDLEGASTEGAAYVAAHGEDAWHGGRGSGSVLPRHIYGGQETRLGRDRQKGEAATDPVRTDGFLGIWRLCLPPGLRQRLKHNQGPAGRFPRLPR